MLDHLDVGIQLLDREPSRFGLRHPDPLGGVNHLTLEVRLVDLVVVDEAECADARRGQVERRRRSEPAGADQQHPGVEQLELSLDADLGEKRVP
jgi:hypothetical protein